MKFLDLFKNTKAEANAMKTEFQELSKIHAELIQIEAIECAEYVKQKAISGVALGLMAFFLSATLLVTVISALGILLQGVLPEFLQPFSWHLVALLFSVIFLVVILQLSKKLKRKPEQAFFSHSIQEFKQYNTWLQKLSKKEKSNSSEQ